MNFVITEKAAQFYKRDMHLNNHEYVTFYVRVGGVGSGGFSVGIRKGRPPFDFQVFPKATIYFCILEEEKWYFDGMTIDFNEDMGEMTFNNPNIEDVTNPK
ncbi:iron-sulfur cluster biosynthesis family protein [Evansella sp. AB-P1]|uniref:iron-sulfur cluster biosynthesis family protein n=1 Tax=Evansella sp. AB-P1 TaxID=3037653 RepID=UPI00241C42AF|nr:iron-sulfur cluster biosynthesis family protein [Evansella sp. AB-P1]MDG5788464.1 iron-sulfur cluster biosynthesis family protein [Evansella sp. AB-P1]